MDYDLLKKQLCSLAEEETWYVSLMANAAALLFSALEDVNWAGFYIMKDGRLSVGPFQGRPACIHIELDKGVCGTAAAGDRTVAVDDVHSFPGHIACDSASNSEIVIPIHSEGKVAAVLDIDSPFFSRFTDEDRAGLELFIKTMEELIRF